MNKRAIKIAAATAVAASAFVATAPLQSNAASNVITTVDQAVMQMQKAYHTYSDVTTTSEFADINSVYKQYNAAKVAYENAKSVVIKAGGSQKDVYFAKLDSNFKTYITDRVVPYIDAYNYSIKDLQANQNALQTAIDAKNMDDVQKHYNEISYQLKKRTVILDRVYGKTTRELLRSTFKAEAQDLRDSMQYDVTVAMKVQAVKDAVSAEQLDVAKKAVDAINANLSKVSDTFKTELTTQANDAVAAYKAKADITMPVISNIKFSTNNADNTKAMIGDIVTLTFTSDEPVTKLSNFKINGSNPDTFTHNGNVYTATHLVDSGDQVGAATFQINVKNDAGIYSQTIENTTDGSSVSIIDKYAKISDIKLSSSNVDPTKAVLGDTISLMFTSDEPITKLSNFKINGSNPDTLVNIGNLYMATHKVDAGDVDGPVTFQINVKNDKGIYSPTIEATTNGSFVSVSGIGLQKATDAVVKAEESKLQADVAAAKELVDALPADIAPSTAKADLEARLAAITMPMISNVKISSNNADNTKAMVGDTLTLTFTSDQPITKLSNFKINGSNPDTFTHDGNVYTATHLVDSGDTVGAAATFQINVENAAGIYSQTVENTTDGSSVGIIDEYARISNIKLSSSNVDSTKAVIGDTIYLTFTSDESIMKLSNFKIDGSNPDTFGNVGNMYVASHKVDAGDVNGVVTFQINVKNDQGIYSPTIEATTDGSFVNVSGIQ